MNDSQPVQGILGHERLPPIEVIQEDKVGRSPIDRIAEIRLSTNAPGSCCRVRRVIGPSIGDEDPEDRGIEEVIDDVHFAVGARA